MRWAWTMSSHGDQAKTVNRPSWEATIAMAFLWSWQNCVGREVARAPELCGLDDLRHGPFNGLGGD